MVTLDQKRRWDVIMNLVVVIVESFNLKME